MDEIFYTGWLIPTSQIRPGKSAVLGENYLAFYIIHGVALTNISISVISCFILISWILFKWKSSSLKINFSVRFPFYLAVGDILWGLSHFTDHFYLITTQVYPEGPTKLGLSIFLWFFLGYQQLMHACLATIMYLRVVHCRHINLGKYEWKLQTFCLIILLSTVITFSVTNSFGCTGYWFLEQANSTPGHVLGFVIACFMTTTGFCTTGGRYQIKKRVEAQKKLNEECDRAAASTTQYTTASRCLTTYIYVGAWLYCPSAVLYWALVIQNSLGVIEPTTCFLLIITCNCSGWANALGYFYNERVKNRHKEISCYTVAVGQMPTTTPNPSTTATSEI